MPHPKNSTLLVIHEGVLEKDANNDRYKNISRIYSKKAYLLGVTRVTGYNFRTVRNILIRKIGPNVVNRTREALIDKFKADIDEWLENDLSAPRKQRHTAKEFLKVKTQV